MSNKEAEKRESTSLWQIIEQTLLKFNERLEEVDKRLSRIEVQQSRRTILNETQVPESPKLLGGRTLMTSDSGTLERLIRLPVCDICGNRLDQDFFICSSCGKKICKSGRCGASFHNKTYCVECLKELLPLSKKHFKVLVLIASDVTDIKTISDLTKINKNEVRTCFEELLKLELIAKKGASIFSKIQATDYGIEAIGAYHQVYGEDKDVIKFQVDLQKHVFGE